MDTIRELIIQAIIARAAVILTTGTPQAYATDIGATVLRARPKVDPTELPCTIVWPHLETAKNVYGKSRREMPVKVEGLVAFGTVDPSVISERILGDLIKCFTSPAWEPGYIESIVYQSGGVESPLDDGSISVGNQAVFLVVYDTKVGDPYTQ